MYAAEAALGRPDRRTPKATPSTSAAAATRPRSGCAPHPTSGESRYVQRPTAQPECRDARAAAPPPAGASSAALRAAAPLPAARLVRSPAPPEVCCAERL